MPEEACRTITQNASTYAGFFRTLLEERRPEPPGSRLDISAPTPSGIGSDIGATSSTGAATASKSASIDPTKVTVRVIGVPADKIRDVIKVAVMPLAAGGADVSVAVEVIADSASGIPRNTIELVVKEGLRQLGVQHAVEEG